jgi:DNA-binding IclR family transcriptional regulator
MHETPGTSTESASGYGQHVPAVDQAARILFALAGDARGRATLTELCREVGIYKSKGQAILNTLRAIDLVTKSDQDKTYALGPALLLLSRALLDQADLPQAAAPFLDELAQTSGTSAILSLIRGNEVYIAARRESPGGVGVTVRVGYRYPVAWGSMGKAIVAFFPEVDVQRLLAEGPVYFAGRPGGIPEDPATVAAELATVRKRGYATDIGGIQPGLNAVSAPLFGARRPEEPVGCLTVFGTFTPEESSARGAQVSGVAHDMSARLGALLDATALPATRSIARGRAS